jgi:tetratricopeptide (TPR) repeat protein
MQFLAELLAARCEFDQARELLAEAESTTAALGVPMTVLFCEWTRGAIEALAGRWEAAEAALRRIHRALVDANEGWSIGGIGALLGEVLLEQRRTQEAREQIMDARAHAPARSLYYQSWWRRALARVEARDGRQKEAESLARQALQLIESSDWLYFKAETQLALADVLRCGGNEGEASQVASLALALLEQKRHLAGAKRARAFLAAGAASVG